MAAALPPQAPSKVVHIRNLPEGANEAEISAVCAAYGPVMQVMVNVGRDRNQAFVQFADINSAVQLVNHHAATNEPLLVRGKNAYVQYSNRQEISSNPRDNPSKVLLITMDNTASRSVTVDILQSLFSTFGFVEKIATFDKGQGFQALVQFDNPATAQTARDALDNRPIPQYLAPGALPLPMRINFSSHNDITVKFQGHKSRDYTNPYLPVASNATDLPQASMAPILPPPSQQTQHEGNVLLCAIDNAAYPMTVDPLHTVFSKYGNVEKIAIFEKNGTSQALVQYSDIPSANSAKMALEGHAIFEGGYNKLRISTSVHKDLSIRANSEKSWDYTEGKGSKFVSEGDSTPSHHQGTNEPIISGIDFEQAHESVVKMAQHGMASGQGMPGGSHMGAVTHMGMPGAMQHMRPPQGMPPAGPPGPEAFGYMTNPAQYGMAPLARPQF